MLKYLKILILSFLILNVSDAFSQESKLFAYYDTTSLKQYLNKDWNELIKLSRKAYREGIDYYYLRMRTGIAYFENKNYLLARRHFIKASEFNVLDPVSREYVYYCLLYSGKEKEANRYFILNKALLKNKVTDKNNLIKNIYVETAYQSNTEENLKSLVKTENTSDENGIPLEGSQIIPRRFIYSGFLLKHELSRNFDFFQGGSILKKYNYYFYQYAESPTISYSYDASEHSINLIQYYPSLKYDPGAGIYLRPSYQYIGYSSPAISYVERSSGSILSVPSEKRNFYTARLSAGKSFWLMDLKAGVSFSKLSKNKQIQQDITFSFFPLGNLNLYSLSTFYQIYEGTRNDMDKRLVFQEDIGFRINDNMWLEARAMLGEIKNMTTNESYIVYNGTETINGKYMLSFLFPFEKMTFSLRTSFQQYYSSFFLSGVNDSQINKLTFNGYSLIGGLSWNF